MAIFSGALAAIGAIGTWFGGLGIGAQIAVRLIAGLAFNALSRALAGDPPAPAEAGITGQLQQGADLPRSFILGRTATAGSLVYHNHWGGAANDFYTRVTALSDLPVTGLVEIWVDGKRSAIDWQNADAGGKGYPIVALTESRTTTRQQAIIPNGEDRPTGYEVIETTTSEVYGWVRFHDGTQTTADAFVIDNVASDERPWSEQDVGLGVAYAVLTFRINRQMFQALPQVIYVLDGVPLLDPETGQTGTGDDLPAVQAHAILSGLQWNGTVFYGPQTTAALTAAEWAAEVVKCRAAVPGASGMSNAEKIAAFGSVTVPARYRSGLEVSVDTPIAQTLEDIISACNGRISHTGTRYRMQVGDPGSAVFSLSDGDILSTAQQEFAPFFPLAETVNAVSATYPEPDEAWQNQEAPPLYNADYEAEEGGRRLPTTVQLPAVPYREQVQRLMASALAEARRARRHTFSMPARYWALEPGDFGTWTSARNGYSDKLMRVDGVIDLPNGDVVLDLTEVDPGDYSWAAATDYAPVAVGSISPQPLPAWQVSGWQVDAINLDDGSGNPRRPAIMIRWTDPGRDQVRALQWQMRLQTGAVAVASGSVDDVALELHVISEHVLPGTDYELRARFYSTRRSSAWTGWTAVTTDDTRLVAGDISAALFDAINADAATIAAGLIDAFDLDRIEPIEAQIGPITERIGPIPPIGPIQPIPELITETIDQFEIDVVAPIEAQIPPLVTRLDRSEFDLELREIEQRSLGDALDRVAQDLSWALLQGHRVESLARDAGIVTDPENGRVSIAAVESVRDEFGTRISDTEIRLDAQEASINLRATYADVSAAITAAQLDEVDLADLTDLTLRVSTAEIDISALEGAITLKADTTTVSGMDVRLSSAEVDIDSLEAEILLRVETSAFDALDSRVQTAEIELSAFDGPSIRQTVADTRFLADAASISDVQTLRGLLNAYDTRRALRVDLAYATQDMRALVDEDRVAIAEITTSLGAAIDANTALIETETSVRASETSAFAQTLATLEAETDANAAALTEINTVSADSESGIAQAVHQLQLDVSGPDGPVTATATAVSGLATRVTTVEGTVDAQAQDLTSLASAVVDAETGIAAGATALSQLDTRVSGAEGGLLIQSRRYDQLVVSAGDDAALQDETTLRGVLAQYDDRVARKVDTAFAVQDMRALITEDRVAVAALETALGAAIDGNAATILQESQARADADGALAQSIETLTATAAAQGASIVAIDQVSADSDSANARAVHQLQLDVTAAEGGIAANASATSGLESRVTSAEGTIVSQAVLLTSLSADITDEVSGLGATATAVQNLTGRVTSAEGSITAQAQDITTLQSDLATAEGGITANAGAVSDLATRVTSAEGSIAAQAQDITTLQSSLSSGVGVPNADFALGDLTYWTKSSSLVSVVARGGLPNSTAVANAPTPFVLRLQSDAVSQSVTSTVEVRVQPGDQIDVSALCAAYTGSSATVVIRLAFYDADDIYISPSERSAVVTSATWVAPAFNLVTVPAGAHHFRLTVRRVGGGTGDLFVADVLLERRTAAVTANAGAVSDLATRVTSAEGSITAQAQDITTLQSDLATAEGGITANAGAVSDLATRVTSAEGSITAQAQDITTLQSDLSTAEGDITANAGAVSDLATRVTSAEGSITAQAQDITTLQSDLATAEGGITANAGAVSGLTTRVTTAEGAITSQASSLASLTTTVGGNTATIQAQQQSLNGISAEYALRIDLNGHVSGVVLRSDLDDQGVAASAAAFQVDKFAIVAPDDSEFAPFVVYTTPQVINGATVPAGVYMKTAAIHDGFIDSAMIGDVIESANYAETAGTPTAGWRLTKDGTFKSAGPVIARDVTAASGFHDLGAGPVIPTYLTDLGIAKTWIFQTTLPITAWEGLGASYVADAKIVGVSVSSGGNTSQTFWGCRAEILPLTAWFNANNSPPGQFAYLKVDLWARQVSALSKLTGQDFGIEWRIYKVN